MELCLQNFSLLKQLGGEENLRKILDADAMTRRGENL
jgi:hypothetical protein